MRKCFESILQGDWVSQYVICSASFCRLLYRSSDAFTLDGRVDALTDLYGQPDQCSVWRTWQGWLSMRCVPILSIMTPKPTALFTSSTGPGEGTIRFFPDLLLSTAYVILRPFFSPAVDPAKFEAGEADIWDPKSWKFGK